MPEEDSATSPQSEPPSRRRSSAGLAGETTGGDGMREEESVLPSQPRPRLDILDDFEIISKLGQGGMGTVWRATQLSLDRHVALKVLPAIFADDPIYVARFRREAHIAANLRHPNLVTVYTSGVANDCHYIAMELIEGETLSQWVKRGPLPPLEALRIILDVARALECGWRTAQLIHRDVKPGNIFLSQEGHVKLGDLGLAKIVGDETTAGLTQTGKAMGTPHYISPEQVRGDKDIDFRADIYSLGCTLYHLLTGQTPYRGSDPVAVMSQHRDPAPPPGITKLMPQCPVPLARLVGKMMNKQRRERFGSYEELIVQTESVQAQLDPVTMAAIRAAADAMLPPPAVGRLSQTPPTSAVSQKRPTALFAAIAAAVLILGIVGYLLWPKAEPLTAAQRYARDHAGELKAKGEAAALVASLNTASKDAPFENSFGMKFAPVPIVGGPTSGQRVLFCIWDTRVQDYEAFVKETKREWPKPDYEQGPTHPAVNLSWEDAQLFCQWLTAREHLAAKLPQDWSYRLPSDHEWSCAVGIGPREDASKLPNEKSDKVNDIFPWGREFPPPSNAGNYWSEELRPALEAGKYTWVKGELVGRNDGYANTSPVGSFVANLYGLYDMGGNVWQWCDDWFDKEQRERVLRGASWDTYDRYYLLSSRRYHSPPGSRSHNYGFRCVVGMSAH